MKLIPKKVIIGSILLPVLLSFIHSSYGIAFLFTLLINITLATGIHLLWGFSGYMNLGFLSFFGLGAYGTAILCLAGRPFLFSLLICLPPLTFLAGLMGFFLFRLQRLYFSVASLGVLILLEESAGKLSSLSGGPEGLSLPLGNNILECFWLSLGLALFSIGLTCWMDRSRLGYRLRMIREDERMAGSVGIPVLSSKISAYVMGAFIALISGAIYVHQSGYISPSSAFGLSVAMPPVIMALIGGDRRWWGPMLGAVILTGIQEILWTGFNHWVLSGYGAVLLVIGIFQDRLIWGPTEEIT